MFAICDDQGYFLVEGSKHRGSAAGFGRVVSESSKRALRFETQAAAEAFLGREYDDSERRYCGVHVVGC